MTARSRTPAAVASPASGSAVSELTSVNQVLLIGRVAALPEDRELPSGDLLVAVRIIVDRPPPTPASRVGGRPPTIDTIDCVAFAAASRRAVLSWQPGDVVSVDGSLRRRFWRGGQGLASRYEVEIHRAKRVRKAS